MQLDAVVELRVNESALLQRVETRVAEMRARGEEVRVDDTPEVLSKRLASYRALTEPLIHYYSERRKLLTVDGMMTIEHVTREINRILAAIGAVRAEAKGGPAKLARQEPPEGRAGKAPPRQGRERRQKGRQDRRQGRETGLKGGRKAVGKAAKPARRKAGGRPEKAAKKVTKKRAKTLETVDETEVESFNKPASSRIVFRRCRAPRNPRGRASCSRLRTPARNSEELAGPRGIGDRREVRGPYCRREYPDQQARPDRAPVHPWHRPEECRRDHGEGQDSRRSPRRRS